MTMLASVQLCFASFVALALLLSRHHRDVLGAMPSLRRLQCLRLAGWSLLAASPIPLFLSAGGAIGLASWFGAASLSGLMVMVLLAYRPQAVIPAALTSVPFALVTICLSWSPR